MFADLTVVVVVAPVRGHRRRRRRRRRLRGHCAMVVFELHRIEGCGGGFVFDAFDRHRGRRPCVERSCHRRGGAGRIRRGRRRSS